MLCRWPASDPNLYNPSPLPSPGGRGRSSSVTCTCIFFVGGLGAGCVWRDRIRQIGHSTETPEEAGFARLHPLGVPNTRVSLSETTGGHAWLRRRKQYFEHSTDVAQTGPFPANVQSAQRRRCTCKSRRSIALSRREREGVRGCPQCPTVQFLHNLCGWMSAYGMR